jgi:hypothetical protein
VLALQLLDGFHVALLLAPDLSLAVVERPEGAVGGRWRRERGSEHNRFSAG